MPTTTTNKREQELENLFAKIKAAAASDQKNTTQEITKALALLAKSKAAYEAGLSLVDEAISLLEDLTEPPRSAEYMANVARFPEAEFGRKKDGTPRQASGKQAVKLRRLKEQQ